MGEHSTPSPHLSRTITRIARNSARPIGLIVAILFLFLLFSPIFPHTFVKSESVPFTTQKLLDPTIEIGDTQTKQTGTDGTERVTYAETKSLFNIIFGISSKNKPTQKSTIITKQPIQSIISSGIRKYQYMYCSNGSYRYYTDTQFKDPSIGFSHKSVDYCAQNNQGTETQLADAPPLSTSSNSSRVYGATGSVSIPSCTTSSIPYRIDYQNVGWLLAGQTQTSPGLNGTYFSCLGTTVQPLNEIVYIGTGAAISTGTGTSYNAQAQADARATARQKCTSEYNSTMAQINALGAGSSSAVDELNVLYSQCLNAAQ